MLITGNKGFVGEYMTAAFPIHRGFDLKQEGDIADEAAIRPVFEEYQPDVVVNLAAKAGVRGGASEPETYIRTNVSGTRLLLSLAEEYQVLHFIHFSSSSVFGDQKPPNSEEAPMLPRSLYGVTKAASEMLCRASAVPTTVIRPFTLYGKHGRTDQVVYTWLNYYKDGKPAPFFGDGTTKRGYTHVEDVIDGVRLILEKGAPAGGHEIFNLGGAEIVSLMELADIFRDELPDIEFEKLPKPEADVYENWADIGKAKRELGWEPKRQFEEEMRSIIRSFKETL